MTRSTPGLRLPGKPTRQAVDAIAGAAREIIGKAGDPRPLERYFSDHRDRLALDYDWIRQAAGKEGKVCELGAGPFFLTRALMSSGCDVCPVGIANAGDAAIAAATGIALVPCNIETQQLPFADGSFDHVLLNEVFEHLRIDPVFTMSEILRVLRRNGSLWLSTPNLRSLRGIVNFLCRGQAYSTSGEGLYHQYRSPHDGTMGHVREYTANEVTAFLSAVGYSVQQVIYRGEYANPCARLLTTLAPAMKPYFSVLARRE